jgi:serine protease Do
MILSKIFKILMTFVLSISFNVNSTLNHEVFNPLTIPNVNESNNLIFDFDIAVLENARKSVVTILIYDRLGNPGGIGSGIIYQRDNEYDYILTNQHVVAAGTNFEIVAYDMQKLAGVVMGSNSTQDVAVVRTSRFRDISVAPIGNSDDLKVGMSIFAIGNPGDINYRGSITTGVVSGVNRNVTSRSDLLENQIHAIQVNVAINPGNSGGPIFTSEGILMGVNTLKLTSDGSATRYEGINFALPINDMYLAARKIVQTTIVANNGSITQRGIYQRTSLGFGIFESILDLSLSSRRQKGIPDNIYQGVYVTSIEATNTNPLVISNLRTGSIIVAIDDQPVVNKVELRKHIYQKEIGQDVKLTILEKINGLYQQKEHFTRIVQAR